MLRQIKKAAQQTNKAEVPARVLYGTVTALSPLTVLVDSRFELMAPALVALQMPTSPEEGDRLALLRNQGGQQYFIIGRV